ncbi:glycosyltransferase family 2 protein [Brachybacterium massiliense]|uniref:glycosyltransferase family 2 protein n=1 Tax=Brachybacterium massiliense TaxID=1755098 RepID=UPI000B3BCD6B|nr:glycosyltransferase family 2 protein [Brachybacterium massiliense]
MSEGSELIVNAEEAAYFRLFGWRADRWAISSESMLALEIFAHLASSGTKTYAQVVDDVDASRFDGYDSLYLARLFRIVAVRPALEYQHDLALKAMDHSVPEAPKTSATIPLRSLYFELLFWNGRFEDAEKVLAADSDLAQLYHGYFEADLLNPYVRGDGQGSDLWLDKFNEVFRAHGLAEIDVSPGAEVPFDGLTTRTPPAELSQADAAAERTSGGDSLADDCPLVSVILTTFNPQPAELLTSVRSIVNQTWRNIELLVVDDHSTEVPTTLFDELRAMDHRVRVIRMPQNGGTYLARNAGIQEAEGEYVTGQDTDDWSHPQRIEKQLRAFHGRQDLAGVVAAANRTDDRLVRTAVGFLPQRRCEVSLMFRRDDAVAMGGYLPMRKGADSEFRERLMLHTGGAVEELSDPLYMTRLSHGSLSRADFRHGWTAPHRLAFSSAYRAWHGQKDGHLEALATGRAQVSPFTAPRKISGQEATADALDVCFVADWRANGELERAAIDEIGAVIEAGANVGILHLDSPFSVAISPRALNPIVQAWINGGVVTQVMPDEDILVRLMIVRDPAVIDYARSTEMALQVERLLFIATDRPHDRTDEWRTYDPSRVGRAARRLTGVEGSWVLEEGLEAEDFSRRFNVDCLDLDYPLVVSERYFARPVRQANELGLVVGRGNGQFVSDWPEPDETQAAYLTDPAVDVRILGDSAGGQALLGLRRLPPTWTTFRNVEHDPIHFWRSVHVVFHFDRRSRGASRDRAIIEALAAGTPVLCSPRYERVFGNAVIGVDPQDAVLTYRKLLSESAREDGIAERGVEFVRERFSSEPFVKFIAEQVDARKTGRLTA